MLINRQGSTIHTAFPRFLALGLLVCLTILVYLPVLHYSFLNYDDDEYVIANPNVRSGLNLASLKWAFLNRDVGHWQPITWISHLADCSVYRLNPAGHHLSSVLLHTLNVNLLFVLLYWISGSFNRSLFVAALFAVHPVNVESVAWIAERKTLICTLFTFVTVAAYVWYAQRPRTARYLVVVLSFSLAVMSKSMAVTIPIWLLLLDYWVLGRWKNHFPPGGLSAPPQSLKRLIVEKIPLLAISGVISLSTLHAQEAGQAVNHDPLGSRIPHVFWSYAAYPYKLLWPSRLSILYPYPVDGHPAWKVALAIIGLVLVSLTVLRIKPNRYMTFGWFFYLVSMLPVIGIIRVGPQSLSDHYLYSPAIGLFVFAVCGTSDLLTRASIRREIVAVLGGAVILSYTMVTAAYLPSWKNSFTVFSRAERLSPTPNDIIENNVGEGLNELGRASEAIPHYRVAISLAPQMPLPYCSLGEALVATGDPYGAIAQFQAALQRSPTSRLKAQCLNNLGVAQLVVQRADLAEQAFTEALELSPADQHSLVGRGSARLASGNPDDALADLHRALQIGPDPLAYYWLGKTLAAKNQREDAIAAYKSALAIDPELKAPKLELDKLAHGKDVP